MGHGSRVKQLAYVALICALGVPLSGQIDRDHANYVAADVAYGARLYDMLSLLKSRSGVV